MKYIFSLLLALANVTAFAADNLTLPQPIKAQTGIYSVRLDNGTAFLGPVEQQSGLMLEVFPSGDRVDVTTGQTLESGLIFGGYFKGTTYVVVSGSYNRGDKVVNVTLIHNGEEVGNGFIAVDDLVTGNASHIKFEFDFIHTFSLSDVKGYFVRISNQPIETGCRPAVDFSPVNPRDDLPCDVH